jgi:hypothetical protein
MKNIFVLIIFIALSFSCCKDRYPDDFYGTYEKVDSINIQFSKIKFYRNNHYSFSTSSCLEGTRDTGEFFLDENSISFKSFQSIDTNTWQKFDRRLTKFKFNYKSGRIYFLRSTNPSLKSKHNESDTIMNLVKTK